MIGTWRYVSSDWGAGALTTYLLRPTYLADGCQPVFNVRPRRLRSYDSLTCVVRRSHDRHFRWSLFCCSRAMRLELLASWSATKRLSWIIQTAFFKDLLLLDRVGPRRFVAL